MSSILFCTPCYGGMLHAAHFRSCMQLKEDLIKLGVAHDWLIGDRESLVHRARMEMTATFLQTEHSHMMWLDADIEFTSDDVAKLWNMQADIAVGVYAMKKREEQWFAAWKDGELVKDLDRFDGPTEVDYAGTGFMLIKREAIVGLAEKLKTFEAECRVFIEKLMGCAFSTHEIWLLNRMLAGVAAEYQGPNGTVPALYMTPILNSGLRSEDYYFCEIARDAGFKVIMDPSVRLGHWGQFRYGA